MFALDKCLEGLFDSENKLRSPEGINNPQFMSQQMQRLSQWTGSAEEHLAQYEKDYEIEFASKLRQYIIVDGMKPTPAEAKVDMDLGEIKGQIKYLTRLTGSAWKQVGVIQSRINHLTREATTLI